MTSTQQKNVSEEFENAVSKTGFGKYNIGLLFTCGLCIIAVYTDGLSMAIIVPAAQCDLNLSLNEKIALSSVLFIGVVLSSLMWGSIADSFGRKKILVICMFISFFCGIGCSLAPYPWLLILFKFIDGFFIGCPYSIVVPYLGEFHGNEYRNKSLSWIGIFVSLQLVFIAVLALGILPMDWAYIIPGLGINMKPWRYLIVLYSIPSLLSAFLLLMYPESPKYLWDSGRIEEALVVLKQIQKVNNNNKNSYNIESSDFKPTDLPKILIDAPPKSMQRVLLQFKIVWNQIKVLYQMPLLPSTLMISIIQFGLLAGANGVFMWLPQIYDDLDSYKTHVNYDKVTVCDARNYYKNISNHLNTTEDITECSKVISEDTFIILIILGIFFAIFFILVGFLNNIMGSKFLFAIVLLVSAASASLAQIFDQYLYIIVALGVFMLGGPSIIVVQNIIVEIYPTKSRGMAMCVGQMFGRIGAYCGSYVCGYTLEYYCSITFFVYTAINLVLLVITCFIPLPFLPSKKTTDK